jgi:SpoVK/Ycf46/Vps4 family AAA+-type ATPase
LIIHSQRIQKYLQFAEDLEDSSPALREIDTLTRQRNQLKKDIEARDRDYQAAKAYAQITDKDVAKALKVFVEEIRATDKSKLGDILKSLVSSVVLDSSDNSHQIVYHNWRDQLASPRGVEPLSPP